jgi:hypothetical protein
MKLSKYIPYIVILILGLFLIFNYFKNDIQLKRIYETSTDNINYEISAIYFSNSFFDKIFENKIKQEIEDFKQESKDFYEISPYQTSLYINQDVFNYSKNIVSFKTTTYKNTGGAHGNTFVETSIINTKENKIIKPENLIIDIEKLSNTIKEYVVDRKIVNENDIFDQGLDPKIENFKTFVLSPNFATFYFSPYQIAPYYYGVIEVNLMKSDLKEIMNFNILK